MSLLTGIDVAACAANQVTIDVENQECTHSDKNDLTEIRSGKHSLRIHVGIDNYIKADIYGRL